MDALAAVVVAVVNPVLVPLAAAAAQAPNVSKASRSRLLPGRPLRLRLLREVRVPQLVQVLRKQVIRRSKPRHGALFLVAATVELPELLELAAMAELAGVRMHPVRQPLAGLREETRQSYSVRLGAAGAEAAAVRLPDWQARAVLLMARSALHRQSAHLEPPGLAMERAAAAADRPLEMAVLAASLARLA